MGDYWSERAIPLLQVLSNPSDRHLRDGILSLGRGRAERNLGIEMSDGAAHDTILQLADAGYVEYSEVSYESGGGAHVLGLHITGRGLQVLGEWPRFEALVSPTTLAALLEALAESAPADEAKAMKRAAAFVRRAGPAALRSLAFGAGGQVLRNLLGMP